MIIKGPISPVGSSDILRKNLNWVLTGKPKSNTPGNCTDHTCFHKFINLTHTTFKHLEENVIFNHNISNNGFTKHFETVGIEL